MSEAKHTPGPWEGEAKISRITISRLEARVAQLEAAIAIDDVTVTLQQKELVKNRSAIGRAIDFINADLPIEALSTLRAALKGKDDG